VNSVTQLIDSGIEITLIGMTVVFALLAALVFIIQGMSAFCRLIVGTEPATVAPQTIDDELLGVIAAAIRHYRRG
jgi:sodium pump decarboxylase gamma subunit